ncbi:MAG TPA: L,D-transpeptidase [Terriglobales bacterium]|nr:L,D-transpeptidase [Terriglobales bacterium]
MLRSFAPALVALAVATGGCTFEDRTDEERARSEADSAARPAPPPPPELRLEVDLAARRLTVFRNEQAVATHPVAVGSPEWPTPTGEWTIGQVIFNPRWVPPEESWAEDEEIAEPGDPDNPLGRAQLVYQAPNSIHGTNEPESLGQAVSHGSIRVSNEVAVELARMVMQAGGARADEALIRNALANPTERVEVAIPRPVPIRVVAGGAAADSAGGAR